MNLLYPLLGIILAFSWCIFIMNSQLDEIRGLKAQLSIAQDYERDRNDTEHQLVQCSNDVDYLKQGLEEVIATSERM